LFYYLIYLIYFLGDYFYLKSEFSNIIIFNKIILLNIISLFMSLDLIKNDKIINLFIEEYYIALSIKYLNNYICLMKNLRWRHGRSIVKCHSVCNCIPHNIFQIIISFVVFFFLWIHTLSYFFFPMYTTLQFNSQSTLLWTLCFDLHHFANECDKRDRTPTNSNER